MNEETTFNRLRRIPLDEMLTLFESVKRPPPIFTLGGNAPYERSHFYPEIVFYLERMNLLKENGWDPDEFYLELEKKSITKMVEEYNSNIAFPKEFIDRAKTIFPNIKFTPARLELE